MVNCLTFLIVPWCCAVWSVSTWFSPHTSREVCYCGHLCLVGIGGVVCVLQALVLAFVSIRFVEMCSYDASRQPLFCFFWMCPCSLSEYRKHCVRHSIEQAKRRSLRHNFYCTKCFYSFHKIHLESSILNKIKLKYLRDSV